MARFSTMRELVADLAWAVDAGAARSSDYDLEGLAFDYAAWDGVGYVIDSGEFWEALPEYVRSVEAWARIGGAWCAVTIRGESDLAQVDRRDTVTDHEWSGWSDLAGMVCEYREAGYFLDLAL